MQKKKLYKRQSEGLFLIAEGMETQLNKLKDRSDESCQVAAKLLDYWSKEIKRAMSGNKHFKEVSLVNRYRITLETVLDVDAENEEEAYGKIPEFIETCDMYILDTEEIGKNNL